MRLLLAIVIAIAPSAGLAAPGKKAKPLSGAYIDTKQRFEITPAAGWELAPLPGDALGMNFRKLSEGVPASLHVMVQKTAAGQTVKQTLNEAEQGFKSELGYNPGTDVPAQVGQGSGMRRTLSVYASGDRNTVRSIELYVVHAFGHAHILHFETLEKKRGAFTKDLDRMLASYVPMAGKDLVSPLGGSWINTGGGPDLTLDDNGAFSMGPLSGGWSADGGQLVLQIPSGAERYRYLHNGDTLTLSSPNLGGDLVFRRSARSSRPKETLKPERTGPLQREELIGTWNVLDQASSEPLRMQLAASGSVSFGPLAGRWRYSTGRLTITSVQGATITYAASMTDGRLVLSGGDLDADLTLERQ